MEKDLRKIKMKDVNLPCQNKIFLKKNLCLYYNVLWSKSKKLYSLGKVNSFFISGGTVTTKVSEK